MMKKSMCLLTILVLTLCAGLACAEGAQTVPATVTASASVSIPYTPDGATLQLGVNNAAQTVAAAQEGNAALVSAVLDALRAAGIADADLQTSNYSINPVYDYDYGKLADQEQLQGYEVTNMLSVTINDLTQVGAVIDAAVAAGANQSYGLNFFGTGESAAHDQALAAATAEALRKAELLCTAVGRKPGALVSLSEGGAAAYETNVLYTRDAGATPIMGGTLNANASVTVTLAIQ